MPELTVERLDAEIAELNRIMDEDRQKTKARILKLTRKRDEMVQEESLRLQVESMTPEQRARVVKIIGVKGAESQEAVGTPGA